MVATTDLVFINEIAPMLGVSPAALFQAGCRKEIELLRVGGRWACARSEAQAFADTVRNRAHSAQADSAAGIP